MIARRFIIIIAICATSMLHPYAGRDSAARSRPQLTVLYDNYLGKRGLLSDNGFSCIIRGTEKTLLFDTGSDKDILLANMRILDIDPGTIDCIVISHDHADHTGGLLSILEVNPGITVYLPERFGDYDLISKILSYGARTVMVKQPTAICKGVFATGVIGEKGLFEQSLVINSKSGLVLLCGCAHPGITNIVEANIRIFNKPVVFVFGGFHSQSASQTRMMETIKKLASYGVFGVGGSHCTEDEMRQLLQAFYGKNYVPMGVGGTITLR